MASLLTAIYVSKALAPGIIQAVFATVTDAFQFKLAKKLVNERTAWMSVSALRLLPFLVLIV